jgi:hypothetical protein
MYQENLQFPTVKSLLEFTEERGLGSRTELQIFATICGLFDRDINGVIRLSKTADVIAQVKPDTRADLTHLLICTGWRSEEPRENTELWAYREVVDFLWKKASVDTTLVAPVVTEQVRNKAFEEFGEDVSFSLKSIRGVRKWLEALSPPVMQGNLFNRRHFCHPELLVLATSWVAQHTDGEIGIDYLLTPERREAICKLCLLDPAALDRVLDWMLPLFPTVIQPGTRAGVYGRFLRFLKWPEMSDLLRS